MARKIMVILLLVAASGLTSSWIASYVWPEQYSMTRFVKYAERTFRIECGIGVQQAFNGDDQIVWRRFGIWFQRYAVANKPNNNQPQYFNMAGIQLYRARLIHGFEYGSLTMPPSMALLFLLAYPMILFARGPLRRFRRRRRGLCTKCGYNLTGAPEPRCPECGTEILTSK